jgi:carboxyl-terminal processing protease
MVLVNHLSASASEIFAGAIQDYKRGLIVGEQTFGKGTVQTLIPLYQGKLKITEAKFYRISGDSTQHRGVIPDINYPSSYPFDEVGESALEHALPWDTIDPAPHYLYNNPPNLVETLQKQHENRMKNNIEYDAIIQQRSFMDEQRERKVLPLNKEKRIALKKQDEDKLLAINNSVRKLKGEPAFTTMSDFEDALRKKRDDKNPNDDFLLMETGRIVADLVEKAKPASSAIAVSMPVNAAPELLKKAN